MNTIYFNLESSSRNKKKKKPVGWIIYGVLALCIIITNIVAWLSIPFCDWHTKYIFPIWVKGYGSITSLFPFSVGEILLILGVLLVTAWIILGIIALILKKSKVVTGYSKVMAWIILVVCFIMTQNCSILYHNSTFLNKYLTQKEAREYTVEELATLRDYVVEQCNALSELMTRDERQDILYNQDMMSAAISQMRTLSETYPELKGYYVSPKYFTFSGFFSQQYIMGYYFPFSMEANINKVMYIANIPSTVCHELSHIKGYMREYDANFISYLACINSDDLFFQYCGYLSVLNYIDNDFYDAIGHDNDIYFEHVNLNDLVIHDNIFLTEDSWKKVEEKAVINTETVKEVSDNLMETSLVLNGVNEGKISYNEVVGLLLRYYQDILY